MFCIGIFNELYLHINDKTPPRTKYLPINLQRECSTQYITYYHHETPVLIRLPTSQWASLSTGYGLIKLVMLRWWETTWLLYRHTDGAEDTGSSYMYKQWRIIAGLPLSNKGLWESWRGNNKRTHSNIGSRLTVWAFLFVKKSWLIKLDHHRCDTGWYKNNQG